jgi:hypothetical protein
MNSLILIGEITKAYLPILLANSNCNGKRLAIIYGLKNRGQILFK